MDRPVKYRFVPKKRDIMTNDHVKYDPVIYYQIALYKTKRGYEVRRVFIDGEDRVRDVRVAYFSKDRVEKFVETKKSNLYKVYPVYSLKNIPYPSTADITTARSEMILVDHNYSGYAPYC